MSWQIPILAITVAVLNISLNVWIRKAAVSTNSAFEAFFSKPFLISFLIGTASICALTFLYSSKVELGRAIIMMGAISIVGGAVYSIVLTNYKPDIFEIFILGALSSLFIYRYIIYTNT